ncbi:hypothetical protein HUJ05_004392 [Dendroctonus ponderosae]|nr:hypothetical protein HUJ05_004392 [Dendroctonus ponderosae]
MLVAGSEGRINPSPPETVSMSTAIINGHNNSTEDFTKHVFGGGPDNDFIQAEISELLEFMEERTVKLTETGMEENEK